MQLDLIDRRADPRAWARELSISEEAVRLYLSSDVIDLHLDTFIWNRIFGYDLWRRHGTGLFGARFYSHCDLPRLLEACVTGATWIITTNPLRPRSERTPTFLENLQRLRGILESDPERVTVVRNAREYRKARELGRHGAFLGIQGGNALDSTPDAVERIPDDLVLRVTLVHLSSSTLGTTSSPLKLGGDTGLTPFGREMVERLDARRIFVDLAHVSKRGFWDAVEVHDRSLPLIVTHTGVEGVRPHWRNLDDAQVRAIADSGGTIGIMYQSSFLAPGLRRCTTESLARHIEHVVKVAGDDFVSLGSDWDGMITPPDDLRTPNELPRLVQVLLERGMKPESVQKVLGGNFLRAVSALRG